MHADMEQFISSKIEELDDILREEYGDSLEKVSNVIGDDNGDMEVSIAAQSPEDFVDVKKLEKIVNGHGFKTETTFITVDQNANARAVLTFYYYAF